MKIVIDSNSIVRDYRLKGSAFQILLEELSLGGDYELNVPAVVIDETTNKLGESIREAIARAQQSVAKLKRLTGEAVKAEFEVDDEKFVADYHAFLVGTVEGSGGRILPYPDVSHIELVRRELLRKKPFSSKGTGYRDALIWSTVTSLMKTGEEEVAFISENTSDFATEGNLHADLADDLRMQSLDPKRLLFFSSLQDFIDLRIKPNLEPIAPARREIETKLLQEQESQKAIAIALESIAPSLPIPDSAPSFLRSVQVVAVNSINGLRVDDIREVPSGDLYVEATIDANVEIDYRVDNSRLSALPSDYLDGIYRNTLDFQISAGSVMKRTSFAVQMLLGKTGKPIRSISSLSP